MRDCIQVTWTAGSIDEARKISRYLVQERYVACAQIVPWIESIYMWDNRLETSQETLVIFKTTLNLFPAVKDIILKNCQYDVPEILATEVVVGHEEYVKWLLDSVGPLPKEEVIEN